MSDLGLEKQAARAASLEGGAQSWQKFGRDLMCLLTALKEQYAIVCQAVGRPYFVQFVDQGQGGLRAEAVSNNFLVGETRLDNRQTIAMLRLGWQTPTGNLESSTPHRDPEGSPNFFMQLPPPIDYPKLARLAIRTLRDVYKIASAADMRFELAPRQRPSNEDSAERGNGRAVNSVSAAETAEALKRTILAILREISGIPTLDLDADGDLVLEYRGLKVYFLISPQVRWMRITAVLADAVPSGAKLLKTLNTWNAQADAIPMYHQGSSVIAALDLPARPFTRGAFVEATRIFCNAAHRFAVELKADFATLETRKRRFGAYSLH